MEKIKNLSYVIVTVIGGGLILFLFFRYVFALILPFLIALLVALLTRAPASKLSRLTHVGCRFWRVVLSVLIAASLIALIGLLVYLAAGELWQLLRTLGEGDALRDFLDGITSGGIFGDILDGLGDVVYNLLISFATALGSQLSGFVTAVPSAILFLVLTLIATVYFSLDLEGVFEWTRRILPPAACEWLKRFKDSFFSVIIRYIKSYLLLMLITFSVILVGLVILAREYALLLALVIAFLDLLPVIGVGTILIPWGIFELTLGDAAVGVGLIILFIFHELVRQLAEPRILGKSLGVHPILTLMLFYFGYSLFGFIGILLVPIVSVVLKVTLTKEDSAKVAEHPTTKRHEG